MENSMKIWYEYYDEKNQCLYYYNSIDHSTQWTQPVNRQGDVLPFIPYTEEPELSQDDFSAFKKDEYLYSQDQIDDHQNLNKVGSCNSQENDWYRPYIESDIKNEEESHSQDKFRAINKTAELSRKIASSKNTRGKYAERSTSDDDELFSGGRRRDYVALARIYKLERVYLEKKSPIKCVICFKRLCKSVLFPCEHMCVCDKCIQIEHIVPERDITFQEEEETNSNQFCFCPLCNSIIKVILPFENGKENEKYWDWVYEVKPQLDRKFLSEFKHSAAIIQKIHIEENIKLFKKRNSVIDIDGVPNRSSSCVLT